MSVSRVNRKVACVIHRTPFGVPGINNDGRVFIELEVKDPSVDVTAVIDRLKYNQEVLLDI